MDIAVYENLNKTEKKPILPFFRQLCLSLVCVSFAFMVGLCLGTPTVAVPQLKVQANSTLAVSDEMASWITSITSYTGMIWVIVITTFAHHFGRKKPMILIGVNTLVASFLVYYSNNVLHIFISQFIHGMTHAAHTTVGIMVITEFTSPKHRGVFLTLKAASLMWGIWVANAVGIFSHYKYIGLVGIACSFYCLITVIFMPESPYWLASQGKYYECAVAHRWLKGRDEESEKELDSIIRYGKEQKENKELKMTFFNFFQYCAVVLRKPEIFKPIVLSLLVICLLNFSGKFVCAVYSVEIMKKITDSTSVAHIGVLILDGFTVAGTYAGCFLSRVLKRRTLLIIASSLCSVFLLLLSFYLYLVKLSVIVENNFISVSLLVAYSIAASSGPLILSTSIFGEMYPVKYRSFTVCIICIESKIVTGTFYKLGPLIFKTFDMYGTFLFFGVVVSICIILVYKYLPETKDKTLQEISEYFCLNKLES